MAHRARLDHDLVYLGVEEVEQLQPGDVEVPSDCDLKAGAYRWNASDARFDPLPPSLIKGSAGVDYERALYDLCVALHGVNAAAVPAATAAWCVQYETSMDADGGRRFDYFRQLKGA